MWCQASDVTQDDDWPEHRRMVATDSLLGVGHPARRYRDAFALARWGLSGQRNGKCVTTGQSNSVTEPGVVGPGTPGIAVVRGTIDMKLK